MMFLYCLMMLVISVLLGFFVFNDAEPFPRLETVLRGYGLLTLFAFVVFVMAHQDTPILTEIPEPVRLWVLLAIAASWAPLAGYKVGLLFGLKYTGQIK